MRQTISRLHQVLAWLAMAGWLAGLYLIGAALFGVTGIELHRRLGYGLAALVLLILIVALVGRLGRRQIGFSALLLALVIVQGMLPSLRTTAPWLAALHPVNMLSLMAVTSVIARSARLRAGGRARETAADNDGGAGRLSAAAASR